MNDKQKETAEYLIQPYDLDCLDYSKDQAFDSGADYGEILFARTLLESMGIDFEYPCMDKEK